VFETVGLKIEDEHPAKAAAIAITAKTCFICSPFAVLGRSGQFAGMVPARAGVNKR
jgi:hypothetical protein